MLRELYGPMPDVRRDGVRKPASGCLGAGRLRDDLLPIDGLSGRERLARRIGGWDERRRQSFPDSKRQELLRPRHQLRLRRGELDKRDASARNRQRSPADGYGSVGCLLLHARSRAEDRGLLFRQPDRVPEWRLPCGPAPAGRPNLLGHKYLAFAHHGLGQPISVSGWAKMAITNGYSDRYAYLEQYFDQAFTLETSGNVTTNTAGVLSPYGEFFPTMPGQVALVTMPDFDTGQRGTGVVNVIKLQLDVDHNGVMDLSFAGPDNTSAARPFTFWVNNDCDTADNNAFYVTDPGHDAYEPWNQDWTLGYIHSASRPGGLRPPLDLWSACPHQWRLPGYPKLEQRR